MAVVSLISAAVTPVVFSVASRPMVVLPIIVVLCHGMMDDDDDDDGMWTTLTTTRMTGLGNS
jgi:hypothetical protein